MVRARADRSVSLVTARRCAECDQPILLADLIEVEAMP
jgi:hypothetical protein